MTIRSNDALELWKLKHQELVQQLTPQPGEPEEKLELARRNLGRAERALADADPDQALISAEAAMVNAADAILARHGVRLRGKTGAHEARFDCPMLPPAFGEEARLISAARSRRNVALYDHVDSVPVALATAVAAAAKRLVDAVAAALSETHPPG